MLRVPQYRPGRKHRGPSSCVISERSAPLPRAIFAKGRTPFPTSSLLYPLTPLFPLDASHSPVTTLFPLLTQKQGGTPLLWYDHPFHFGIPPRSIFSRCSSFFRSSLLSGSGACPDPVGMVSLLSAAFSGSPLVTRLPAAAPAEEGHYLQSFRHWRKPGEGDKRHTRCRTAGNRCPTCGTDSYVYHCIKWRLSARRHFCACTSRPQRSFVFPRGQQPDWCTMPTLPSSRRVIVITLRGVVCKGFGGIVAVALTMGVNAFGQTKSAPVDPGVRGGPAGAGGPLKGLTADETAFFQDGLARFAETEAVTNGTNNGLGPRFNSNQCLSCHSQPGAGGSSPAQNPQIAVATLNGAKNTVPWFVTQNGPAREARFKK